MTASELWAARRLKAFDIGPTSGPFGGASFRGNSTPPTRRGILAGNTTIMNAWRDIRHTAEDRQAWHVRNHHEASVLADLYELCGYPHLAKRRGSCLHMGLSLHGATLRVVVGVMLNTAMQRNIRG